MILCEGSQQHPEYGKSEMANDPIYSTNILQRGKTVIEKKPINEKNHDSQLHCMEFM